MPLNKKGTILITSLWILSILSVLAVGIGFRVSIEARLSKYNMDRIKGLYLAKAGIVKSQQILSKDTKNYDSMRECGIVVLADKAPENVFNQRLGDGGFSVGYDEENKHYVGMADEERKININTAPLNVLQSLLVDPEAAASIINWRGTAQISDGAWNSYYESLPAPYKCKHANFSVPEESMLVKGMTPQLYESVKDYITVYGDGKVNINTATKRVMLAFGLSEPAIDQIITFRNGVDKVAGTKDDVAFYAMPRQGDFQYLTPNDIAILGNYFTTTSNYFRIESKGMIDGSRIISKITAVAKKGDEKLVYYREY